MNIELVAQMFKNYQSNVLFHLEGVLCLPPHVTKTLTVITATNNLKDPA